MRIEELDSYSYQLLKKMEDSLKMLLDSDSSEKIDISDFDENEFNRYAKKLQEGKDYSDTPQGRHYKLRTLKKIFNLDNKENQKIDLMLLNKDKLNRDYSVRHNLILKALVEEGTRENPVVVSHNGITVTKYGLKCDQSEIALWDYLLGQFVENGGDPTKLILNEELSNGLGVKNLRGERFNRIKDSLMVLGSQFIKIDDSESKDKATKQIRKNISEKGINNIRTVGANLLQVTFIEIEGQLAIKFNIPLMKMHCSHKQYDRLLSGQAIKHWYQNPRIYLIAKELASLTRNKNNNTLSAETLLKNIGEWERYKGYSDKKKYLSRLRKDIDIASGYILDNKKFTLTNFTESKLKQGRIKAEEV